VTCSVINFVLIIFLSWTFFISLFPHSTLCLLVGIVVGFIELPFCCWCIPQCNQLAQFMSPLKIYWIRGCGYLFMALFLFAAYWGTGGGILMVIFSLMLTADGVCYVLAHFKGESETQESGYDTLGARTCSRRTQCPQSPAATRPRVQLPVHTSHARPRARTRTHTHTSPHLSGLPLPPLHRQLSTLLSLSCAHQNVDKWRQLHQHQHQRQQHQQRSPTSGIQKTSSRIAPTAAACFPMPNRGGRLWGRMSFSLGVPRYYGGKEGRSASGRRKGRRRKVYSNLMRGGGGGGGWVEERGDGKVGEGKGCGA